MSARPEETCEAVENAGAYLFEVACDECSTCLIVYSAEPDRPFVPCPRCGALAGGELPPGVMVDLAEGFDEDGPAVQVHVAYAFDAGSQRPPALNPPRLPSPRRACR